MGQVVLRVDNPVREKLIGDGAIDCFIKWNFILCLTVGKQLKMTKVNDTIVESEFIEK
jgi:hypothetical protein